MEEEVLAKAYDSRLMRRLLGYMWPYWRYVGASLVFLLLNSVLQVAGPLLTKIAVDKYLAPDPQRAPSFLEAYLPASASAGLNSIAIVYLAVLLGILVFEFGQTYIMQYTGQLAMFDLRRELMAHLQ
ncbi:MAG: ABC transporter transmembrane domain-containing protein, partial [Bryobacteraceae bacterium]